MIAGKFGEFTVRMATGTVRCVLLFQEPAYHSHREEKNLKCNISPIKPVFSLLIGHCTACHATVTCLAYHPSLHNPQSHIYLSISSSSLQPFPLPSSALLPQQLSFYPQQPLISPLLSPSFPLPSYELPVPLESSWPVYLPVPSQF